MNADIESTVTDVRSAFDTAGLARFLTAGGFQNSDSIALGLEVPQWKGPLTIKQFVFGQSNPTFLVIDANNNLSVVRRKPFPNNKLVSKSAHAIEREFFILNGINRLNSQSARKVPVPSVHLLCEDESVCGYVFYVMQFIDGRAIKTPDMQGVPESRHDGLWRSIMDTAAAIHSLDADQLVALLPEKHFPQFKKPSKSTASYFERQVRTLGAVSEKQATTVDPIPSFDEIKAYILRKSPKDPAKRSLIHGDFKIDNLIFDKDYTRVIAVLDWELCTFGHPLFDLANFLQPYQLPNKLNRMFYNPIKVGIGREQQASLDQIAAKLRLYQDTLGYPWDPNDRSNNPIDTWQVGFVFGLFRLCVISQGIGMRIKKGSASSANAASFGSLYKVLAEVIMQDVNASSKL